MATAPVPTRRRRRAQAVLTATAAAGFAIALLALTTATTNAATADPPIHFATTDAVKLGTTPQVVRLLNDGAIGYDVLAVNAELYSDVPTTAGGSPAGVAVVVTAADGRATGNGKRGTRLGIGAGGQLALTVAVTKDTPRGTDGWLTVSVGRRPARAEFIARLPLTYAAASAVTGVTAWSVGFNSPFGLGAKTTTDIPLSRGVCADAGPVSGVLVSGDHAAQVTSAGCAAGPSAVHLTVDGLGAVGAYKGAVKVGDETVTLEIVRARSAWIAVAAIVLGLFVALLAQGATDRGWSREQLRWLRGMKKQSATADSSFKGAAAHTDATPKLWAGFVIAPSVAAASATLLAQRDAILSARGPFRRWFPWPKDFMIPQRKSLLDGTKQLDQLIRDWPAAADHFVTVASLLNEQDFTSIAPELHKRGVAFVKGTACPGDAAGNPAPVDDFRAMVAELAVWPEAVAAVRSADDIGARIDELRAGKALLPWSDRVALEDLVRKHRASMWALSKTADARVVVDDIGPELKEQLRLATGLAVPKQLGVAGGDPQPETQPGTALSPWFDRAHATLAALSTRGDTVVNSVLIALTVAIALWTGLQSFYVGKPWGTWPDIVTAFGWGFVTSALATPVLAALRSWGSRPADAAEVKASA